MHLKILLQDGVILTHDKHGPRHPIGIESNLLLNGNAIMKMEKTLMSMFLSW
jgi:hypothetical protein